MCCWRERITYAHSCTLLLLLLIVSLCDATDYSILNFHFARRHELWMAEYGQSVQGRGWESTMIWDIQEERQVHRRLHNAGEYNNTLGVNRITDLTHEEFWATTYMGLEIPEPTFEESLRSIRMTMSTYKHYYKKGNSCRINSDVKRKECRL